MIPPFDPDGELPKGLHQATWLEFKERFCIFTRSDRRLRLCRQMEQMVEEAHASQVVERIIDFLSMNRRGKPVGLVEVTL